MEAKPIITCHGNQTLFSSIHPQVVNGLPKEVCEWRRSYGRAPRSVQLEGSFVPYDPDILPEEDTKTLVSRPYFHIYWTDCDLDTYKQSVRDDLAEWQAALKAKNIPDWLIVVVIPDESKVKAKLLPRSSVIDKVRNDFCSKQPERSIVLTEPLKTEPKSAESWHQFFQKLRSLLLQAYNRHLNKYEENMRGLRERRNEPGWNYFEYFAVQEELGFMLEVLGLREDALIQYDELDAMFDQFVENHASGAMVKWLSPLLQPCHSWTGLSLAKPLDFDLRDRVKRSQTSLLEFRNYLFCRQAALLFAMGRAWEVAERSFDFLHNTVAEMKALNVELPEGALQCWEVLSGLEVLAACQKHDTGQVDKCAIFTAHLWDHIRNKLKELGQLCSLMPGTTPTSQQLSQVVDLKAGMVYSADHVDKLQEALSSPSAFKKHYLEMCELAMGTFKHISRFRSSRMIGRELASFYMKISEAQKAEVFLLDAIKMYRQEGWVSLAHATMRELATCQKQMGNSHRYLKTACEVACSRYLSDTERRLHYDGVMSVLDESKYFLSGTVTVDGSGLVEPQQLELLRPTVKLDEEVTMVLQLHSNFPQPLTCQLLQVSLSPCPSAHLTQSDEINVAMPASSHVHSQPTVASIHRQASVSSLRKTFPSKIGSCAMYERRQGKVIVAGITCENSHELLKRTDSTPITETPATPVKGDYSHCLSASDVVLQPGLNDVELKMKTTTEGVFVPSQACVHMKSVEMVIPLSVTDLQLRVACYRPSFTLVPKHSGDFVAGIEQAATFTLNLGSQTLESATSARLCSSIPVRFSTVHGPEGDSSFTLPAQGPRTSVEVEVRVYLPLDHASSQSSFTPIECVVDGWPEPVSQEVRFLQPLRATHRIYTARETKYVQITLSGDSNTNFVITSPELSSPVAGFTFLNPTQEWSVSSKQAVSFVWQLEDAKDGEELDIAATFTCQFTCEVDLTRQVQKFTYDCRLSHFQVSVSLLYLTWYILDYWLSGEMLPAAADLKSHETSSWKTKMAGYKAGVTYTFNVSVTPVGSHCSAVRPHQLAYKVTTDSTAWALSGKTTGVFSVSEKAYHTQLKAVPLAAGFCHLPRRCGSKRDPESVDNSDSVASSGDADAQFGYGGTERGRVYNASLAKQVHVFPTPTTSDMEVTML
ncbi:hypothetical protein BaRGS_00005666 [Batillaria attramentaria]|uniref:Trafficking protein particle complex subunit 10 n=1 Tax=Batillaria attramentaria TaxID=370345 RepID=A0ABD0LUX3_9CAEN